MKFNDLYHQYKDLIFNLSLSYLQNKEDAEDATQEIFVKIHGKQDSFRAEAQVKTWMYRIAINHCLDRIKAQKRIKRFAFITSLFQPNSSEIKHDVSEFNHPGIQLEQKEALAHLFKHINDLPEQQKTALILTKIDQLSMKETAEIMNKTAKSIESLLQRAKQNLKKKLNEAKELDEFIV